MASTEPDVGGESFDATDSVDERGATARTRVTRRTALAGLLGLGLGAAVASESASAQPSPPPRPWQSDQNANGYDLLRLGGLTMVDNPSSRITDFLGENLVLDRAGVVNVEQGPGSGLDADTLDGQDSTAFAAASHDHAGEDLTPDSVTATTVAADSVETTDLSVTNVGVAMYRDGAQTIQYGGTFQQLQFNATEFDHREEFDATSGEFVAATDGYYHIDLSVRFVSFGPGGAADFQVRKNGTAVMTKTEHSSSPFGMHLSNSRLIYLEAGDRLAVFLKNWSSNGGSRDIVGNEVSTYMHVYRVG